MDRPRNRWMSLQHYRQTKEEEDEEEGEEEDKAEDKEKGS